MREAQRTDLVILARETHFHFEAQDRPDHTLGEILRASPRPVVVVPRDVTGGHGVVVAYNGSPECARTLQTVQLLGLAGREPLDVLTVHPDPAEGEAIAQLAGAFLSARGAAHRLHVEATDAAPAAVILDAVRARRPRLVVMGAHAHHPMLDMFAGSVARRVLAASPVPVLLGA
jgi:nucleotide-binding universal stress UspA family protein